MIRRISTTISTLILIAAIAALSFLTEARGVLVRAADASVSYAKSAVMDDLKGATIDGKIFDLDDYPAKADAAPELLLFTEYCFSKDPAKAKDFGLFAYVYNPGGITFDNSVAANTYFNKIQLAVNEQGYRKYSMIYLNRSTAADGCDGRFYKFQISLGENTRDELLEELAKSEERVYKLSGFELRDPASFNATEYAIAQTYTFTGYVKGYGAGAQTESTLTFTKDATDILDIERQGGLRQTFYRPSGSNGVNEFTQDTLQSVYFSIPNKYFENDFTLTNVRMEWLKAQTAWGFVTGNKDIYNALIDWVGVNTFGTWDKMKGNSMYQYKNDNGQPLPIQYGFSSELAGTFNGNRPGSQSTLSYIPFLFHTSDYSTDSGDTYIVPWETILEWMQGYTAQYDHAHSYYDEAYEQPQHLVGQDPVKGGNFIYDAPYNGDLVKVGGVTYPYSRALFQWVAKKKSVMDISADMTYTLTDATIDRRWKGLDADSGYLRFDAEEAYTINTSKFDGIKAIYPVGKDDFKSSKAATCNALYINIDDYDEFKEFYDDAAKNDETVVLIRYDVGTYQAVEAHEGVPTSPNGLVTGWNNGDTNCRTFNLSVYLGVDVIHLEFSDDAKTIILPCISSPIDAGSDGTPPLDVHSDKRVWEKILAVILTVVVAVLIGVIIYKVIKKNRREKS